MGEKKKRVRIPDAKIQSPPPGSVGLRAYARHRTKNGHPISHTGVAKAIAAGRIAEAVWRDGKGSPWIDPKRADELMDQNTDPSAQRETKAGGRPPEEKGDGLFAPGGPQPDQVKGASLDEKDSPNAAYNRSRAVREDFDAKLAEIKFQRETGVLVRAESIRARCESVGILVRDALRNIPPRIAGELAAETNVQRIEERLTDEIDLALEALAELARPLPV